MKQTAIIFSLVFLLSCRKEHKDTPIVVTGPTYDTIFPGSYFPAYPHSYWIYRSSEGTTVTYKTDSLYSLHTNYDRYQNPSDSSLYYAPVYNGRVVKGYLLSLATSDYHSSRWEVLIDNNLYVGKEFGSYYSWPANYNYRKVLSIDTAVTVSSHVYDSVIILMEYSNPPGTWYRYSKIYYAKHVGVIKRLDWHSTDSSFYEENLVDYRIGSK